MNITVFLGSSPGNDETITKSVIDFSKWIGKSEHKLVYGGSHPGLMGILAKETLEAGGYVIGVEAKHFSEQGLAYDGLSELLIYDDISSRIQKMIALGDAFIAFPGGVGTLEEIAQVMTTVALEIKKAPCIFYNLNGYYDHLKAQLEHMTQKELLTIERQKHIYFASSLDEIKNILLEY